MHYLIVFIIIVFVLYILVYNYIKNEKFAGALTQLYAKGPQDRYLYGNVEKYIYPYPYQYSYMPLWNESTRLYRPYYGYYGYYGYPFVSPFI